MEIAIISVFIIGYLAITLEHPINVNKTASALLTAVLCWTILMVSTPLDSIVKGADFTVFAADSAHGSGTLAEMYHHFINHVLTEKLGDISQILFFLLGAMTIVELVDAHHGFRFINERITTKSVVSLMWIIGIVSFFLSAILDNLTTSIVMISIIRKLVHDKEMRLTFAGLIVIAANAGGAWTPIGDVTTTMLWIGGQITATNIITKLFVPSLVSAFIPLALLSFRYRGQVLVNQTNLLHQPTVQQHVKGDLLILILGVGALVSVPIFKTITHLPPYIGMLGGLSILWIVTERIHRKLDSAMKQHYTVTHALSKIDVSSVLFFLGILMAVASLETIDILNQFAQTLETTFGDQRIIITIIGLLSSVVDNVPLVAANMGMYSLDLFPPDSLIWEYLAYCAGTGGSILIIGSAAGVAVMGMEKIDFIWYLKNISLWALIGYLAGAATYLILV